MRAAVFGVLLVIALVGSIGVAPRLRPTSAPPPPARLDDSLRRDADGCASVSPDFWHPLSGLELTGRLRVTLPARAGGTLRLIVGDRLRLPVDAVSARGVSLPLDREVLAVGPGIDVPPDFWLEDGNPWQSPPSVVRVGVLAQRDRPVSAVLSLGRRAPRVLARLVGYPQGVRASVCAEGTAIGERLYLAGWYGEEMVNGLPLRWMSEHGVVLLHSETEDAVAIKVSAQPAVTTGEERSQLTLTVNDVFVSEAQPMRAGLSEYRWRVPASAWVQGTNELLFSVSHTTLRGSRTLGMALASLHVD